MPFEYYVDVEKMIVEIENSSAKTSPRGLGLFFNRQNHLCALRAGERKRPGLNSPLRQ